MSLVTIQNRTSQMITIGLTAVGNPSVVEEHKLSPRKKLTSVDSDRVTSYTEGLARRGHIAIVAESA